RAKGRHLPRRPGGGGHLRHSQDGRRGRPGRHTLGPDTPARPSRGPRRPRTRCRNPRPDPPTGAPRRWNPGGRRSVRTLGARGPSVMCGRSVDRGRCSWALLAAGVLGMALWASGSVSAQDGPKFALAVVATEEADKEAFEKAKKYLADLKEGK